MKTKAKTPILPPLPENREGTREGGKLQGRAAAALRANAPQGFVLSQLLRVMDRVWADEPGGRGPLAVVKTNF